MLPRIHILPSFLANQIAAGEVIERPASVIKELLENSLDANASEITIWLKQGGIDYIAVQDNGYGIHPDDMILTVSQHATSKIISSDDLACIETLGFRGEALASISSISRCSITSMQQGSPHAFQVIAKGSDAVHIQPAAHPVGTRVEVSDLFFNTPARRKFLRSATTEWQYTEEVIKRILLSRYDVDFTIYHNDKKIGRYPKASHDLRIAKVFSKAFIDNAQVVDSEAVGLQLTGFVGAKDFTRSSHDWQYFYVNGRMVKDKTIQHAMRQAYGEILHPGRYATYVLYLTLDPHFVDVNVHPTKHEVRFQNARLVHDFIVSSVQAALAVEVPQIYSQHSQKAVLAVVENEGESLLGEYLTTLQQQILITKTQDSLGVIDLHAYYAYQAEKVLQEMEIRMQPLLMVPCFKVSHGEDKLLHEYQEMLRSLGLVFDSIGENQWLLREIPAVLSNADMNELWQVLLLALIKMSTREELIKTIACQAMPGVGLVLSEQAIAHIMDTVAGFEKSACCPHGLKVWQMWSLEDMRR